MRAFARKRFPITRGSNHTLSNIGAYYLLALSWHFWPRRILVKPRRIHAKRMGPSLSTRCLKGCFVLSVAQNGPCQPRVAPALLASPPLTCKAHDGAFCQLCLKFRSSQHHYSKWLTRTRQCALKRYQGWPPSSVSVTDEQNDFWKLMYCPCGLRKMIMVQDLPSAWIWSFFLARSVNSERGKPYKSDTSWWAAEFGKRSTSPHWEWR